MQTTTSLQEIETNDNNSEVTFHRKPMKGKKFARKNRPMAQKADDELKKFNTMERKTWAKDGFHEWVFILSNCIFMIGVMIGININLKLKNYKLEIFNKSKINLI